MSHPDHRPHLVVAFGKVALVAPSDGLFGRNYGAEIDAHDVVVRVNHGGTLIPCTRSVDF